MSPSVKKMTRILSIVCMFSPIACNAILKVKSKSGPTDGHEPNSALPAEKPMPVVPAPPVPPAPPPASPQPENGDGPVNQPPQVSGLRILDQTDPLNVRLAWDAVTDPESEPADLTLEFCFGSTPDECSGPNFTVSATAAGSAEWLFAKPDSPAKRYFVMRAKDASGAVSPPGSTAGRPELSLSHDEFSVGNRHVCIRKDGKISCWGSGKRLGLADESRREVPAEIPGINDAVKVSAGRHGTCFIRSGGTVYCSGTNTYGQLGDGTTTDSLTPVQVAGISTATDINNRGDRHACALLADKTVRCWGGGTLGQLGNGSSLNSLAPVAVSGLTDVKEIDVSRGNFSCALRENGTVACWGVGTSYQLGNGVASNSNVPVDVTGITTATQISVGIDSACARLSNSTVSCWGSNESGKLGYGSMAPSPAPVTVSTVSDATKVTLAVHAACIVRADQTAACWGLGAWNGELGNGNFAVESAPQAVPGLSGVTDLGRGDYTFVSVLGEGKFAAWGAHQEYSGLMSRELGEKPLRNTALETSVAAGFGTRFACTVRESGKLGCFGSNQLGQMGIGTVNGLYEQETNPNGMDQVTFLSTTNEGVCAVKSADGKLYCFGRNDYGQLGGGTSDMAQPTPTAFGALTPVTSASLGLQHTCAVYDTGLVACAGNNGYGQLGDNSTTPSNVPVMAAGLNGVKSVASGQQHTCAIRADDTVACWGRGNLGQLGTGNNSNSMAPVSMLLTEGVRGLKAKESVTCAVTISGKVFCWGDGGNTQFANYHTGTSNTPIEISGAAGATDIVLVEHGACSLSDSGKVLCWGLPFNGVLGRTTDEDEPINPAEVQLPGPAESIFGHYLTMCARLTNGRVYCWGDGFIRPGEPAMTVMKPRSLLDASQ